VTLLLRTIPWLCADTLLGQGTVNGQRTFLMSSCPCAVARFVASQKGCLNYRKPPSCRGLSNICVAWLRVPGWPLAADSRGPAAIPVHGCAIRAAVPADASSLHAIIHAAYRTELSWTTEVDLVQGERISLPELQSVLARSKDPVFVATVVEESTGSNAPRVVGCVRAEWALNHPETGLTDECCMLGLLAVDPEFQSCGIGSALFDHAIQYAEEEWKCVRAVLWVISQRLDIMEWYKRRGFAWTGEVKEFVLPELKLHKDVEFHVLVKEL
jgi:GNAT superfamily N-acetyltransferase